jgi:aspartyl/asparaginyl-tRNA synthetase
MTVKELSQYMKNNQDNPQKWQKAYDLFVKQSEWQEIPEGATWEEQKQYIEAFISQVV